MSVFEWCWIAASLANSTAEPTMDLLAIRNAATETWRNQPVFLARVEKRRNPAMRSLSQGDETPLLHLWFTIASSEAPEKWKVDTLKPIVARWDTIRKEGVEDPEHPSWIPFFEAVFEKTEADLLAKLQPLPKLTPEHAFAAIQAGDSEALMRWYNFLPPPNRNLYFSGLKDGNGLLRRLRAQINPDLVDPSTLPDEPRITLIRTYLESPIAHQLQPFYDKTFAQLVSWKMITAEELFDHEDELLAAHIRQGMAYLDLARVYRENKRYDEALENIEKGLGRAVLNGNRLGGYLLEKTIILREAERFEECRRTFASIPYEGLDRGNREHHARIEASLRDLP